MHLKCDLNPSTSSNRVPLKRKKDNVDQLMKKSRADHHENDSDFSRR
ncbi:hypothetical protein ANCCAN_10801 [Ancylostoma caninum]|uniref:Uncharacterized protein n=1 Tax=Ancylostoma caninum TaxID=29170 RepID=A0A368GFR7_ANCCA|nr:hypothetical protein ANCCAN_10801 [Ancylostoma caninum]